MATIPKTDPSIDDIAAQISALKSDLAGLTELMTEFGKAQGRTLGARANEAGDTLRARGRHETDKLQAQAHDLYDQTNDFVVRQPGAALGIAAGLGFVIGMILRRG